MSDTIEYNRPNEKWECGWAKRGFRCHVGPTPNGKCPGKGECQPLKKEDGYHCTRLPQYGGKCHQGPLPDGSCSKKFPPCSPKRTLRAKRGLVALSTVAISLGIIFFYLGQANSGSTFFSPGPVSFQHSSILNNCSSCHSESHSSPVNWLLSAGIGEQKSSQCLECHKLGDHPFKPHSLPQRELAQITKRIIGDKEHKAIAKEMQCNSCHKEHKGTDFDLTAMSKKQCQTCHAEKFDGLNKGHPEFTNYPFEKRVNILFDHTTHFSQHFPKKDAKGMSCNNCHSPSSSGEKMELVGFERACATCHKEQIHGDDAVEKGIAFFRLPTLDVETLTEKGHRVGSWPEDADGELTPFTKLLLAADEDIKESLQHISEEGIELDDLSEAEKETIEHVVRITWGLKKLLHRLKTEGAVGLSEQISGLIENDLDKDKLISLASGLPPDVFRSATGQWFKSFDKEIESLDSANKTRTRNFTPAESEEEDEDQMTVGGWYKDSGGFTIKYRPTGHGDNFIQGWLNLASHLYEKHDSAKQVFEVLSHRKDSPGACMKCHSVTKVDKELKVNWQGFGEKIGVKDFVRFSHSSHLNLLSENGCYTCHEVNKEADFTKAYEGFDETIFESNFYPLKKTACTKCHGAGKVKDNCLTCHNYHIGDFFTSEEQMKRIHTDLDVSDSKEKN